LIRTPQYRLPFFQQGDFYYSTNDQERVKTIDSQLTAISTIIGDGILTGWSVSLLGPSTVSVGTGQGFISEVLHKTLSFKTASILSSPTSYIYMRSTMLGGSTGLPLEDESPSSVVAHAAFADITPPATPSDFIAFPGAMDCHVMDLSWSPNHESDFDHYLVERGTTHEMLYAPVSGTFVVGEFVVAAGGKRGQITGVLTGPDTIQYATLGQPFAIADTIAGLTSGAIGVVSGAPSPSLGVPYIAIGSPTNSDPQTLTDTGLVASTAYAYRISALDLSGNASTPATASATTVANTDLPAEATGLSLHPGNGMASIYWNPTAEFGVEYRLTVEPLDTSGNPTSTTVYDTAETSFPLAGLTNTVTYRITLQTRRGTGVLMVLSSGVIADMIPTSTPAPRDVLALMAISAVHAVTLKWTANLLDVAGSGTGQRYEYRIRVIDKGVESAPIQGIGLATTKTVTSYNKVAAVGQGQTIMLADGTSYVFRVTTLDYFGNESAGDYIWGTTLDTTSPNDPRNLLLVPGDGTVQASWSRSSSSDVVSHVLNIDTGAGFGPDINIPDLTTHSFTGLVNGVQVRIRVRAKDSSSNVSTPGALGATSPFADTTPPAMPTGLKVNPGDLQATASWIPNQEIDLAYYTVKRVAVTQTMSVPRGIPLTEATELPTPVDSGTLTSVTSGAIMASNSMIGKNYTGYVLAMISGLANGLKGTIVSMNPANGEMVLSTAMVIIPVAGDHFSIKKTDPSLGTTIRNVGTLTSIFDPQLVNGQTYAYYVKATDISSNESPYSPYTLVSPRQGMNDIAAPTNLVATPGTSIILTWSAPIFDPARLGSYTAFNIYRSVSPYGGFTLIGSTVPSTLTYTDSLLVNGITYYYYITATRDNAILDVQPTEVQPANSILLATVTGGTLTNVSRISESIESSVQEEATRRLLDHKHTVAPTNSTTITATQTLAALDASTLTTAAFSALPLSSQTMSYYQGLLLNGSLQPITYAIRTTYVLDPAGIVWNIPYVGDFQVLVNGVVPTVDFYVDQVKNAIIFRTTLPENSIVSFDGGGLSYYVPSRIDLGFRGFAILVDGVASNLSADTGLQTLRSPTRLATTQTVTVSIEPSVPDFGTQQGARQVNLSPDIVLSDFTTKNYSQYVSTSGNFAAGDTVFVLVNGSRTSLNCAVDTTAKTITFDVPLTATDTVSLEILDKPEVQGLLPNSKIGDIDGSQFSTGQFLNAQLPPISHEGRMGEQAYPLFQTLTTSDKYKYSAPQGVAGTATTPYAAYQPSDGSLLLGSSIGLLKAAGFESFNAEDGTTEITIDYSTKPPGGLKFVSAEPDAIVAAARSVTKLSGRYNGNVPIVLVPGGDPVKQVYFPCLIEVQSGKVIISGGSHFNETLGSYFEDPYAYLYDPATESCVQVGSLSQKRSNHSGVLLPSGDVMIAGGSYDTVMHFAPDGTPDWIATTGLSSVEIYDALTQTWSLTAQMGTTRSFFNLLLLDDDNVLAAGGNDGNSGFDGQFNPPTIKQPTPLASAEIYSIIGTSWTATATMNRKRVGAEGIVDKGSAVVSGGGQEGKEMLVLSTPVWILELGLTQTQQNSFMTAFGRASIDSPVKQFLLDSTGMLIVVSQKNTYASKDEGETFVKMKGLEAVGAVHTISETSDGTLFAATDLGVYEIAPSIHDGLTWFQGGLIGAGTTETFALQPIGTSMLAGTELGIFLSLDGGNTWTIKASLSDTYNIAQVGAYLFANAGKTLYKSIDSGTTWSEVATLDFLDADSKMVGRTPLDLFFATASGLWASTDGVNFFLVAFDRNKDARRNNASMATLLGMDLVVGYDNEIYAVSPGLTVSRLAQFVGTIPTVRVNGIEVRNGFRYDTVNSKIIFERKRLARDSVTATSNYALYEMENGEWYSQNPDAAVTIYANGKTQDSQAASFDAFLGQLSFTTARDKSDVITASIVGTSLDNEGEHFHDEIEDDMEKQKGLPLSLGRDYAGNILQMGLGMEHNFLERGLDRNQYYCTTGTEVDRSMTSFLSNAEFYVLGRRDFDRFNSTIDYATESKQDDIGYAALVPLCALEVPTKLWVGTENGVFILDTLASFAVSSTKQIGGNGNEIRDLKYFQGYIYAVTKNGLFWSTDGGITFSKNPGRGLPSNLFVLSSLGQVAILGGLGGIWYSDGTSDSGTASDYYGTWSKGLFFAKDGVTPLGVTGDCVAMASSDGIAYASIGGTIYFSVDGKTWRLGYSFTNSSLRITSLAIFSKKLFIGTNMGVYNDNSSVRSDVPAIKLEAVGVVPVQFHANDMEVASNGTVTSLYVVGDESSRYKLTSGTWTSQAVPGAQALHRFAMTGGSVEVVLENDKVFVQ